MFASDEVISSLGRPSFRGLDLRRADFCRAYLPSVDFSEAKLAGANFSGAYLRRAVFCEADLAGARFKGAVLRDVAASHASFEKADLREAILLNGCFDGATFREACLARTNLRNASFLDADLTGADLTGAHQRRTAISPPGERSHRSHILAFRPGTADAWRSAPSRRLRTDRMVVVAVYIALGVMIATLGLWSIIMIFITLRRVP